MLNSVHTKERVEEILSRHRGIEGPLLPILHDIQAEFGHVPQDALPIVAKDLNISRAEAHGVMTFYHDFREKPAGNHVLKLCRAEACQAVGADRIAEHARKELDIDWHGTTADGNITLEPVFCLGLCACGPAAIVDGKLVGRVDEAKLTQIIGGLK